MDRLSKRNISGSWKEQESYSAGSKKSAKLRGKLKGSKAKVEKGKPRSATAPPSLPKLTGEGLASIKAMSPRGNSRQVPAAKGTLPPPPPSLTGDAMKSLKAEAAKVTAEQPAGKSRSKSAPARKTTKGAKALQRLKAIFAGRRRSKSAPTPMSSASLNKSVDRRSPEDDRAIINIFKEDLKTANDSLKKLQNDKANLQKKKSTPIRKLKLKSLQKKIVKAKNAVQEIESQIKEYETRIEYKLKALKQKEEARSLRDHKLHIKKIKQWLKSPVKLPAKVDALMKDIDKKLQAIESSGKKIPSGMLKLRKLFQNAAQGYITNRTKLAKALLKKLPSATATKGTQEERAQAAEVATAIYEFEQKYSILERDLLKFQKGVAGKLK